MPGAGGKGVPVSGEVGVTVILSEAKDRVGGTSEPSASLGLRAAAPRPITFPRMPAHPHALLGAARAFLVAGLQGDSSTAILSGLKASQTVVLPSVSLSGLTGSGGTSTTSSTGGARARFGGGGAAFFGGGLGG